MDLSKTGVNMKNKKDKKVTISSLKIKRKLTPESLIFRSDFHKYRKIFRAIFTRVLLVGHCVIAILLAGKTDSRYYGIFAPCIFLFLLETAAILYFRWGCEWKRICTCFCVYLVTMLTVLWILRLRDRNEDSPNSANTLAENRTVAPTTTTESSRTGALKEKAFEALLKQGTTSLLEQSMMFLIIICRWLLPRGRIDRNSLSQLLIMYSAISADILDFSEIFNNEKVKHSGTFEFAVLGVWSWSFVQFILVITTSFTFRRQQRHSGSSSQNTSEIMSILMVFFMQDGPFLAVRCYAIIHLFIFEFLIIFFCLKNILTLILGSYRLLVLCGCISKEGNDLLRKSEIARSMESLDDLDTISIVPQKKGKKKKSKDKETRY